LLGIALAFPPQAYAQAFGVKKGALVSLYQGKKNESGSYKIVVPEPNAEFDLYIAYADAAQRICKVVGLGISHENDDYGNIIRDKFSSFRSILISKYGNSIDFDFLRSGALWDKPRDWVWSIYKRERELTSFWSSSKGANLPVGVQGIKLGVSAINAKGAYITLSYEFDNYDQCLSAREATDSQGL